MATSIKPLEKPGAHRRCLKSTLHKSRLCRAAVAGMDPAGQERNQTELGELPPPAQRLSVNNSKTGVIPTHPEK